MIDTITKLQFVVSLKCTEKQYDIFCDSNFDVDDYEFGTSYPDVYYDFEENELSFDFIDDKIEAKRLERDVKKIMGL